MNFVKSHVIFGLLILLVVFTPSVFAEDIPLISVKTDSSSYNEGDIIIISGKVETVIVGTPVTMQLFNQGNLIDIGQITVAQDGSYSSTINASGPLWTNSGEYTIRVLFGEGNIAETTFNFLQKTGESPKTKTFEVNAGSYGTFDVGYSITGGILKDIKIDPDNYALVVTIESTEKGSLLLEIPREALDAKEQNKSDIEFIVLVNEIQVLYKEDMTNSNLRKITINFEQGDSDIKIIGTTIIPEFGAITIMILVIGIIITTLGTKNKFRQYI
ncbi:MAG: PEFG-CTERM sorting domain-containing protein [Nitrosopumilus sp.]|jgi:predicted secreted protein with PEFG-CTERM motif|nr:PEFG-CTERM sorting domain-containing protein [Nitrosopumilus sp.]